jgi:hypothetical protein
MEAKIICYEVGEKFPIPNPLPHLDNIRSSLTTGFIDIIFNISHPRTKEINDWKNKKFSYGVYVSSDIPFLLIDFGGWAFDASINILKIQEGYLDNWLSNIATIMGMYLVDTDTNILLSMRHISFTSTSRIKEILRKQALRYKNADEVDKMIRLIAAKNTTAQMIRKTKMTKL